MCAVARNLQNLPGLCISSWETANWAAQQFETMKMQPSRNGKVSRLMPMSEKSLMDLRKVAQERMTAVQRVILKQGSFFSSSIRSELLGFRESKLKISSRRGKAEQLMAMKMQGLGRQTNRPMAGRRVRMQQGMDVLRRLSLPNTSSLLRGRRCSSLWMSCIDLRNAIYYIGLIVQAPDNMMTSYAYFLNAKLQQLLCFSFLYQWSIFISFIGPAKSQYNIHSILIFLFANICLNEFPLSQF